MLITTYVFLDFLSLMAYAIVAARQANYMVKNKS